MPRIPIDPKNCCALERRHLTVLEPLLSGRSNAEIAYLVGLSQRTVANYVSEILEVLECESRSELIAKYEWGVVS